MRARRIRVTREKPAMQLDSIARFEKNVLEWPPKLGAANSEDLRGLIDLAMFEPTQHDENQQTRQKQPDEKRYSFARQLHVMRKGDIRWAGWLVLNDERKNDE